MRKITNPNPQQSENVWGRSELIDYQNADGKPLKAILTRPDDFDPSKKYPLMVFIYERLTDGLHQHIPPEPMTNINITRYISNGYIVLRPDIVYEIGRPGESALKCVVPAVRQVLAMGFIDPRRVGIQGHSWGAYEISYMITKTDIFRAVEAGGSPNNFVSAYNMIRWGSGVSRQVTYEKSQSRLGTTLWSGLSSYIENSAIFGVDRVRTPYLTIQGDRDDAVPWWQAIEYALAMRRLGKEAYMFVYHGEPHSLDKRENQKHWTVRMAEYFDYFLKDGPRPEWMDGIPCRECAQGIGNRFYDRVP
ncbi:MAG: prolyl oligopeptidase family serine peptidase [Acidobacteria bacterium]|nr:prolyl oligopeptidase family serine peptidase [Acidobacteriota bacterium]